LLGQKRGPDVVISSLVKGLKELNIDFKYNAKEREIGREDVVYINGSVEALKWAIRAKKENKISKLIVGPVMVVLPDEKENIVCDPHIDKIIVPSSWVKKLWLSIKPELVEKIVIWPAGIDIYSSNNYAKDKVLIYQKNAPIELLNNIKNYLTSKNISFKVIKYGFYKHKDFLRDLDRSKAVIFLSESESQGLAICEAWMKNVSTFVWNRGYWQYKNIVWKDEKISAPYLIEDCGMFFEDFDSFENKWPEFFEKISIFKPRKYAENNFSNKKIAENFLKII
jgi:hypothetical protein